MKMTEGGFSLQRMDWFDRFRAFELLNHLKEMHLKPLSNSK
jgi:hypothetical protein